MKKCSKCKQDKDLSMFGKCSANKDGLRSDCKECRKSEKKKVNLSVDQLYDECHRLFEYDDMSGNLINKTSERGRKIGEPIKCVDRNGYLKTVIKGKDYGVHRIIILMVTGALPSVADHINRDKTDNRWSNLRTCTKKQNSHNKIKKDKRTQCIDTLPSGKFRVRIKGKTVGTFDTFELATAMRDAYAKHVYGEFSPYQ